MSSKLSISDIIRHDIPCNEIALNVFNNLLLVINEKIYLLGEVEMYISNSNLDSELVDPYVHKHPQQLEYGTWYFHRESSATRTFTLKGLDYTFGLIDDKTFAGMLIRAIYDVKGKRYIDGPSKVVDEILDNFEVDSVEELKKEGHDKKIKMMINTSTNKPVYKGMINSKIQTGFDGYLYYGRRIGLKMPKRIMSDKEMKYYQFYLDVKYRYCLFKEITKKEKTRLEKLEYLVK